MKLCSFLNFYSIKNDPRKSSIVWSWANTKGWTWIFCCSPWHRFWFSTFSSSKPQLRRRNTIPYPPMWKFCRFLTQFFAFYRPFRRFYSFRALWPTKLIFRIPEFLLNFFAFLRWWSWTEFCGWFSCSNENSPTFSVLQHLNITTRAFGRWSQVSPTRWWFSSASTWFSWHSVFCSNILSTKSLDGGRDLALNPINTILVLISWSLGNMAQALKIIAILKRRRINCDLVFEKKYKKCSLILFFFSQHQN